MTQIVENTPENKLHRPEAEPTQLHIPALLIVSVTSFFLDTLTHRRALVTRATSRYKTVVNQLAFDNLEVLRSTSMSPVSARVLLSKLAPRKRPLVTEISSIFRSHAMGVRHRSGEV